MSISLRNVICLLHTANLSWLWLGSYGQEKKSANEVWWIDMIHHFNFLQQLACSSASTTLNTDSRTRWFTEHYRFYGTNKISTRITNHPLQEKIRDFCAPFAHFVVPWINWKSRKNFEFTNALFWLNQCALYKNDMLGNLGMIILNLKVRPTHKARVTYSLFHYCWGYIYWPSGWP